MLLRSSAEAVLRAAPVLRVGVALRRLAALQRELGAAAAVRPVLPGAHEGRGRRRRGRGKRRREAAVALPPAVLVLLAAGGVRGDGLAAGRQPVLRGEAGAAAAVAPGALLGRAGRDREGQHKQQQRQRQRLGSHCDSRLRRRWWVFFLSPCRRRMCVRACPLPSFFPSSSGGGGGGGGTWLARKGGRNT